MTEAAAADGADPGQEVVGVARQPRTREQDGADDDGEYDAGAERREVAPREACAGAGTRPAVEARSGRDAQARWVRQYRSAAPASPPSSAVFAPYARTAADISFSPPNSRSSWLSYRAMPRILRSS